jgi:branched-chain amino acid transport system substrate-binding protein
VIGRKIAVVGGTLTLALGLAACGSSSSSSNTSGGGASTGSSGGANAVNIYSSLPLQGASKDQTGAMVKGIQLALEKAGNKAGKFTINYTSLDDSVAQTGAWDPGQTAQNARKAAQDSKAVGYIGEFNSGASAVSIPILNQGGVPQVSPANTYVGLTTSEPGSEKGEPQKYYPSGKRTYLRIVPRDLIQAKALLALMKQDGCTKIAIANDKDTYGAGLARTTLYAAGQTGQKSQILSNQGIDKSAPNYRSYAASLKSAGADCFLFSGITANGAVQLYKDVGAALPTAKLYGPDGDCESGFTNPSKKGIPAALGKRFKCTVATLDLSAYPGGKEFLAAYKAKYNDAHPDPYAIYGYEGMKLFIDTIAKLGDKGSDKSAVLDALFATKNRSSALGTYSFDQNGDTSLTDYGVYTVGSDGNPTFSKAIKTTG